MSADVISLRLVRFARTLKRLVGDHVGVQLVPEMEPEDIRYLHDMPDRLMAGSAAFEVLRRMGVRELAPRQPAPPRWIQPPSSDLSARHDPWATRALGHFGCRCQPMPLTHLSISYEPDPPGPCDTEGHR